MCDESVVGPESGRDSQRNQPAAAPAAARPAQAAAAQPAAAGPVRPLLPLTPGLAPAEQRKIHVAEIVRVAQAATRARNLALYQGGLVWRRLNWMQSPYWDELAEGERPPTQPLQIARLLHMTRGSVVMGIALVEGYDEALFDELSALPCKFLLAAVSIKPKSRRDALLRQILDMQNRGAPFRQQAMSEISAAVADSQGLSRQEPLPDEEPPGKTCQPEQRSNRPPLRRLRTAIGKVGRIIEEVTGGRYQPDGLLLAQLTGARDVLEGRLEELSSFIDQQR